MLTEAKDLSSSSFSAYIACETLAESVAAGR